MSKPSKLAKFWSTINSGKIYEFRWQELNWIKFEFQNSISSLRNLIRIVGPTLKDSIDKSVEKHKVEIDKLESDPNDLDYKDYLEGEFSEHLDLVLKPMIGLSYQSVFITSYSLLETYLKKLVEFTWSQTGIEPKKISMREFVKNYCKELNIISGVKFQNIEGYSEIVKEFKQIRNSFSHVMGELNEHDVTKLIREYDGLIGISNNTQIQVNDPVFIYQFLDKIDDFYSNLLEEHDKSYSKIKRLQKES